MFVTILHGDEADKVLRGDVRLLVNCLEDKLEEAKNRLITETEDPRFIAGMAFTLRLLLSDLED